MLRHTRREDGVRDIIVSAFNTLLEEFATKGNQTAALQLLQTMEANSIAPNQLSFAHLIAVCGANRDLETVEAVRLHAIL
jgi:hypothetical protein